MAHQQIMSSITSLNNAILSLSSEEKTGNSLYFEFSSLVSELNMQIQQAESSGASKDEIKLLISGARGIFSTSNYVNRIQNWPRGYQGDFETVEHINSGMDACDFDTLGTCIEYYSQMLPITQQHRNKLIFQERLARNAISDNKNILSVGCGGAIDISEALNGVTGYNGTISFIDMDEEALELARERTSTFEFVYSKRNIVRGVGREKDNFYDLIICGGLFDYLEDRVAGILLQQLEKKLKPGGTVFLSNIVQGNPFRIQMEYMCDWELIERTESQVQTLLQTNFKQPVNVKLERDATGLAILCSASTTTPSGK